MRRHTDPEDRPSTRTLITLTVTYVVAAGFHGVLAVRYEVRWHGVVAAVLTVAAVAFLVPTVRTMRRRRIPRRHSANRGSPSRTHGSPVVPLRCYTTAPFDWDVVLERDSRPLAPRETGGSAPGPGDTWLMDTHDDPLL